MIQENRILPVLYILSLNTAISYSSWLYYDNETFDTMNFSFYFSCFI